MYEGMFVSMATPCDLNMFDVGFGYLFYYRSMDFITVRSGGGILQLLQTIPTVELIRFGYVSHLMMHITQSLQVEFMKYQVLCLCFVETYRKGESFSLTP